MKLKNISKTHVLYIFYIFSFCHFHSRAHTIVAIHFTQKKQNEAGQNMTKTSVINLVDLAGRYIHVWKTKNDINVV